MDGAANRWAVPLAGGRGAKAKLRSLCYNCILFILYDIILEHFHKVKRSGGIAFVSGVQGTEWPKGSIPAGSNKT